MVLCLRSSMYFFFLPNRSLLVKLDEEKPEVLFCGLILLIFCGGPVTLYCIGEWCLLVFLGVWFVFRTVFWLFEAIVGYLTY